MASIMHFVKKVPGHLPRGTGGRGLTGVVVDKAERYGAAALFGYSKGKYGPKFVWKGHGADMWIGVGSLAAATILSVLSNGRSHAAEHLERIGDAGVMSAIGSIAASYGLEHAGMKVATMQTKPAGMHGIYGDVVGAIAGAKAGPYLTPERIAEFAAAGGRRTYG